MPTRSRFKWVPVCTFVLVCVCVFLCVSVLRFSGGGVRWRFGSARNCELMALFWRGLQQREAMATLALLFARPDLAHVMADVTAAFGNGLVAALAGSGAGPANDGPRV